MKPKLSQPLYQASFGSVEHLGRKRQTRREVFLQQMEQVVPWSRLVEEIEPYYPKLGGRGRPPIGLERMLRLYFIQQWFGLSDEGVEDAVTDSAALRHFVKLDFSREAAPDATTLLKFRRLLETHDLTIQILAQINGHLKDKGLLMQRGTLIDATIVNAPSSTKNQSHERDPEMHQTKKGEQWYFGMKAHIGVDAQSGLVHSVHCTPANVADVTQVPALLHGQENFVSGDAGYVGVHKREEVLQAQADGTLNPDIDWCIAQRRNTVEKLPEYLKTLNQALETVKAKIRARVEHPFHVVKNLFKQKKLRYRGIAKNGAQWNTLFALANLVIAKKWLLESGEQSVQSMAQGA